jgi:hypothetical protein
MKLTDSDIEDLRTVLEAAMLLWQMKPRKQNLIDAINRIQAKIEEHENG